MTVLVGRAQGHQGAQRRLAHANRGSAATGCSEDGPHCVPRRLSRHRNGARCQEVVDRKSRRTQRYRVAPELSRNDRNDTEGHVPCLSRRDLTDRRREPVLQDRVDPPTDDDSLRVKRWPTTTIMRFSCHRTGHNRCSGLCVHMTDDQTRYPGTVPAGSNLALTTHEISLHVHSPGAGPPP